MTSILLIDDCDVAGDVAAEVAAEAIRSAAAPLDDYLVLSEVTAALAAAELPDIDDPATREVIAELLGSGEIEPLTGTAEAETSAAVSALETLAADAGIDFTIRDPSEWDVSAQADPTVLVLIDFRHGEDAVGAELALEYRQQGGVDAHVAVFSQQPGNEADLYWEHLGPADSPIVWIQKSTLLAEDDASPFVAVVEAALHSEALAALRTTSVNALTEAIADVAKELAQLSPVELHRLAITRLEAEDLHEGGEVVSLLSRVASARAAAAVQVQDDVTTVLARLRTVESAATTSGSPRLLALQADELFVPRVRLLDRSLPPTPGDIFAVVDPDLVLASHVAGAASEDLLAQLERPNELLILVAQPCDLAVRPGGTRSTDSRWVESLKVRVDSNRRTQSRIGHYSKGNSQYFGMPAFTSAAPDDRVSIRAVFSEPVLLPLAALDTCTWSSIDAAATSLPTHTGGSRLRPNWKRRREAVMAELRLLAEFNAMCATLQDESKDIAQRVSEAAFAPRLPSGYALAENHDAIAWGLIRVGRLRPPYSDALVQTYSAFRGRLAYPAPVS